MLLAAPPLIGAAQAQTAPVLLSTQSLSAGATATGQEKLHQAGVYQGRPE